MRLLSAAALALGLVTSATCAVAADLTRSIAGYTYFNRPGADIAQHDAALELCLRYTLNTRQPDTPVTGGGGHGLIGALVEGVIVGAINATGEERGLATNVENCMVASGWRVARLPEVEGEALYKLEPAAIHDHLASLVGAEQPGVILRRFQNDITVPETRWLTTTGDLDKFSLSLKGFDFRKWIDKTREQTRLQARASKGIKPAKPKFKPPKGKSPLKQKDWSDIKADATVVIARTVRTKSAMAPLLLFIREGADPNITAWMQDGEIDVFRVAMPTDVRSGQGEEWFVMTLPPGKWRYVGVQAGAVIVSFCLGAPTFVLEPGKATFIGTFGSGTPGQIAPNTDLTQVKAMFAGLPQLRDRIVPAEWINGDRFTCDGTYIYALETPDRPFQPDYRFGSQAWKSPLNAEATATPAPLPIPPTPDGAAPPSLPTP